MTNEHIIGGLYIQLLKIEKRYQELCAERDALKEDLKKANVIILSYENRQVNPETAFGAPNNSC